MAQYAATILITVLTAFVLIILVAGNSRLSTDKKILFMISAIMLMLSALAEYFGVIMDSFPDGSRRLHIFIKVFELSVSPFLVITLITTFNGFSHARFLLPVAFFNLVLQITTGFTGFLYYVDDMNVYHHNDPYWIYTAIYVICGVFFFSECIRFSRQYQNRSIYSLLSILFLLVVGLSTHMIRNSVRIDWLTLTVSDTLFYIYYIGLIDQMDSLTQLLDRKSYDMQIASLGRQAVIIVFDVDLFKQINDTYGHDEGDACLKKISEVLKLSYGKYGLCYRIGGDEFCVITSRDSFDINAANTQFCNNLNAARYNDKNVHIPNVSYGYAAFDPEAGTAEDTIKEADAMMYKTKKERNALR